MSDYLGPEDPGAFDDWPVKDPPAWCGDDPALWLDRLCPECHGRGGWNLKLNAYPLHGRQDTPENRHRYAHLRGHCGACWGWGYLQPDQTCAHNWDGPQRNVGKCLNIWTCSRCGAEREVDSSD